jgi:CheY-like chemotaxis protein
MRLLFVDDEQRVLSGLRRQLHGKHADWELEFAPGGAEALELIAAHDYDGVISDMRMPVIDGTRVLNETARARPRAARLVLSGHAEGRATVRIASCAHRFLDKPCPTDALTAEVTRALAVREAVDASGDEGLAALWCRSPGLIEGMPDVLAALGGDGRTPEDVAGEALGGDALWARVLGVAAAVRHDVLGLDAGPDQVVEELGALAVLAVIAGATVQRAAGGDWEQRLSRGTALAVSAHLLGRDRELAPDELADVVLAALVRPLSERDPHRWQQLSWLLSAWGITPRAAAALTPEGSRGEVGRVLTAVVADAPAPDPVSGPEPTPPPPPAGPSAMDSLRLALPGEGPSSEDDLS